MSVVNALPNGYLVVTLSPREAVKLMDEILEPGDYPWQASESQMIAMEVKGQIKGTLEAIHQGQQDFLKEVVRNTEEHEREKERARRREEKLLRAHQEAEARERQRQENQE